MAAVVLPDGHPIAGTGEGDGAVWIWSLTSSSTLFRQRLTGHTQVARQDDSSLETHLLGES